jgi:hypothetical protein
MPPPAAWDSGTIVALCFLIVTLWWPKNLSSPGRRVPVPAIVGRNG